MATLIQPNQEPKKELTVDPTVPASNNVYDVMRSDRAKQKEKQRITPDNDFLNMSKDITSKTYGFGDAVYDVALDPALTVLGTASDAATNLLLGFDRMLVNMDNKSRLAGGSPLMGYGDSFAGEALRLTKAYAPKQFVDEFRAEVEAARELPDAEDRFNSAKKIAGEYATGYAYMFGGMEVAKMVPGLRVVAKKVDPIFRKQILKNPFTTVGVELTGIAAETEVGARGAGGGTQTAAGIASTILAPTPINIYKRHIGRKAAKDFVKNMSFKDFQAASEVVQRVVNPETSLTNLNKIMKEGSLPPNVRAPLEVLLGDKEFTYLETVLNKRMGGDIEIDVRDTEFLQGISKMLEPVTKGNIKNAEDWFRLSAQIFNKDMAATTSKITSKGFKELNKITQKLPDAEQVSSTAYNSLEESKQVFGSKVDQAWDVTDLDKELPQLSIFDDFGKITFRAPIIKVDAQNINEVLGRFDVEEGFDSVIKKLDEDFLVRLNTDEIIGKEDELRQGIIEATGGSEKKLDKFNNFISQIQEHQARRVMGGVPTGNAFSNPEAMRRTFGDKYLVDVAQDISVPFQTETMQTMRNLADEYGIENLPTSAQEVLNGGNRISTIGDLYNLRKRLGVEGMKNISGGQVNQQAFFSNKLRTAILQDLSTLPDDGNVALKRAIQYSRDYNLTFKTGLVGKILGVSKDGTKTDPRQALQSVFAAGGNNLNITGKINTEQLLNAAKNFKITSKGNFSKTKNGSFERQLQDYMVNLFVNQPGSVKDGSLIPGGGQKFYNKYKSILDLPEMKRAKGIVLNASGDTSVISKMLDEKTSLAKVYAGYFGKESLGAVNAFLGGDITEGLTKMMKNKGGVPQLKELKKLVNDPNVPEEFFTSQGISRKQILRGIKDSVNIALVNIGREGDSATSFSALQDLVKKGSSLAGDRFRAEGDLLPFLREAGFTGNEIRSVQKFADEVSKYNKYVLRKGKAGDLDVKDIDNIFHSVIGLFLGGVGADFFASGSSLAAASYIKNQTKNTLQRLSTNQASVLLSDAMGDPKLLEALLKTPTHFNKNQIAKRRPYLFKYLNQKGFEQIAGPSDEEISKKRKEMELRVDTPIDEYLQNSIQKGVKRSNLNSIFQPDNIPTINSLNTQRSNNVLNNPQSLNNFIGDPRQ